MPNCIMSGYVTGPNGEMVAGAIIDLERVWVNGSRDTAYEGQVVSDSSGVFQKTLPQGSRVRFSSSAVSSIHGWEKDIPRAVAINLGNFRADTASEAFALDGAGVGTIPAGVRVSASPGSRKMVFTFASFLVTLVKNGTSTGGGGTLFYTFPAGLVLPILGSSELTVAADGDASFLASVGTAAADTGGSLATTEANILPSTAATTSSGVGTCKMKSTVTVPTPGAPIDGTTTPVGLYLNAALNADATGIEPLLFSGTVTVIVAEGGDN